METTYTAIIEDDRGNFIPGKDNHIYLYSNIGSKLTSLDELPTCMINDVEYPVTEQSKGIYYATVNIPITACTSPTMFYDEWSNLIYNGNKLPSVELHFTTQDPFEYFKIGNELPEQNSLTPTCYGINDNEQIQRNDIRKVNFLIKKSYQRNIATRVGDVYARLYVMDGTAQCDVIPYHKINKTFMENYMEIDTSILPPSEYHVDVKIIYGMECIEHQDILKFTITNDLNNKYN